MSSAARRTPEMNCYPNEDADFERQPGDGGQWYAGLVIVLASASVVIAGAYFLARWIR
jgi:hypothetical protein